MDSVRDLFSHKEVTTTNLLNELDVLFMDIFNDEDGFMHYGTKYHSGRYPYGSGEFPYQHEPWFQGFGKAGQQQGRTLNQYVSDLRAKGLTDQDIATGFGLDSVNQLRKELAISKAESRSFSIHEAMRLREEGLGNSEIAKRMSEATGEQIGESTVRAWLKAGDELGENTNSLLAISDTVRNCVDTKGLIDIGPGVAETMGISRDKLEKAVAMLENEGYTTLNLQVNQLGTENGMKTTIKVIAPPGTTYKDAYDNINNLESITGYTVDDGFTILGIPPVNSVSSDRVMVTYKDPMDGCIELRRGCPDLDLGDAQYAQVRIGVDGTHYIKGMAVMSDDLPDGVDILFHSGKDPSLPMIDGKNGVLKPMKINAMTGEVDQDNPFGAAIKQEGELRRVGRYYIDENGEKQVSPINVVNEPGDWAAWSKNLPTQFLAKQDLNTIKTQLAKTTDEKMAEYKEISALTDPILKEQLLNDFAEDLDSSAVHLKAAAFPGQQQHVILPVNKLGENEIYAPNYENGTQVACVRYPHAGPYEIPVLTVNNNNQAARDMIGANAIDAVGINPKQLGKLSGADCDGDTCSVIPLGNGTSVRTMETLKGLAGYEPKDIYKGYPGMKEMKNTGAEMGKITNLLTDMWNTIDGRIERDTAAAKAAGIKNPKIGITDEELDDLVRATKHSMVVIDAEKHHLDYKQSEIDNGIKELNQKYRTTEEGTSGGASSLFSRAKGEVHIEGVRTRAYHDDPETGEKLWTTKQETYTDKNGKEQNKTTKSTQMYEAKDARSLMSGNIDPKTGFPTGTAKENEYAKYANFCKQLANDCRKEAANLIFNRRDPAAAKAYDEEVKSLNAKYLKAAQNAPLERKAQAVANEIVKTKMSQIDKDSYSKDDYNKYKEKITAQALAASRGRFNAQKQVIDITPREWEAMSNGALTPSRRRDILRLSDKTQVRQYATPRNSLSIDPNLYSRIYSLGVTGNATVSEIAAATGASRAQIQQVLGGK
jgi:hypothetical protein